MFYNSLVRKGKAEDCTEDDMASVVSVHNAMNEDTWRRVVAWEKLHRDECVNPMLLRFLGRPNDLSPLAWARYLTTGAKPFDRHDWYVDRGGKRVRYVIDYYFDETRAGRPGQFDLVVRPAADSLESVVDRVKMAVYVGCAMVGVPCPISGNNAEIGREIADRNETAPEA
jgi:cytochrome c heme-lyase